MKVELFVGLKVPDTTALTALQTLHQLDFKHVTSVDRKEYYSFTVDGNVDAFKKKIITVDVLVNANKHTVDFSLDVKGGVAVLIMGRDDSCEGLLHTLTERLGLTEISSLQKGVVWVFHGASKKDAEAIGKKLLYNEHFQEFQIL